MGIINRHITLSSWTEASIRGPALHLLHWSRTHPRIPLPMAPCSKGWFTCSPSHPSLNAPYIFSLQPTALTFLWLTILCLLDLLPYRLQNYSHFRTYLRLTGSCYFSLETTRPLYYYLVGGKLTSLSSVLVFFTRIPLRIFHQECVASN